jgi:lambda repressor-like predicted transcriptional regulator
MTAVAVHRGGVAEGCRDEAAVRIASALIAGMPLGRDVSWVRAHVRTLLRLACGEEWTRVEWEDAGADASAIGNYTAASRGEPGRGKFRDPRYTYSKARLLDEWRPTWEEIRVLKLRSLCSDADRAKLERELAREEADGETRDRWLLDHRRNAPEVHRLRAEKMSWRAIAERVGEPLANVYRLGGLSADDVATVAESLADEQREREAEIAATAAIEPEDIVAELLDTGITSAEDIAERSGLSWRTLRAIMEDFGVPDTGEVIVEFRREA